MIWYIDIIAQIDGYIQKYGDFGTFYYIFHSRPNLYYMRPTSDPKITNRMLVLFHILPEMNIERLAKFGYNNGNFLTVIQFSNLFQNRVGKE